MSPHTFPVTLFAGQELEDLETVRRWARQCEGGAPDDATAMRYALALAAQFYRGVRDGTIDPGDQGLALAMRT